MSKEHKTEGKTFLNKFFYIIGPTLHHVFLHENTSNYHTPEHDLKNTTSLTLVMAYKKLI